MGPEQVSMFQNGTFVADGGQECGRGKAGLTTCVQLVQSWRQTMVGIVLVVLISPSPHVCHTSCVAVNCYPGCVEWGVGE